MHQTTPRHHLVLLALVVLSHACALCLAESTEDVNEDVTHVQRVRAELLKIEQMRNRNLGSQQLSLFDVPTRRQLAKVQPSNRHGASLASNMHGDTSALANNESPEESASQQSETLRSAARASISARLTQLMDASRAAERARKMARDRMDERMRELAEESADSQT